MQTPISISLAKFRSKWQTIISGFDYHLDKSVSSETELLTKLKKNICHSNGHINSDRQIVMQGEKTLELTAYIKSLGVTNIITSGTK